jgi:hypothetical protein
MVVTILFPRLGKRRTRASVASGVFITMAEALDRAENILFSSIRRWRRDVYTFISSSAQGSRRSATQGRECRFERMPAAIALSKGDMVAKMMLGFSLFMPSSPA